jgi:hypothetical protein
MPESNPPVLDSITQDHSAAQHSRLLSDLRIVLSALGEGLNSAMMAETLDEARASLLSAAEKYCKLDSIVDEMTVEHLKMRPEASSPEVGVAKEEKASQLESELSV